MNTNCTWCRFLESLYAKDLEAELRQHIESLPENLRASDEVHEARLSICSACEDCTSGVCKYCGCFVAARAAKKAMACPKPGLPKWHIEIGDKT